MNLTGWVWNMLWGREPDPEVVQAKELAQRISVKADRLNSHLETYHRAHDPFAALLADLYNRDQLSRLHRSIRP